MSQYDTTFDLKIKILGHGKNNSAGDSEMSKKERKTEEEMGR